MVKSEMLNFPHLLVPDEVTHPTKNNTVFSRWQLQLSLLPHAEFYVQRIKTVSLTHSSKLASTTRSGENKTPSVSVLGADSKVISTTSALLVKPHVFSLPLCFCYHSTTLSFPFHSSVFKWLLLWRRERDSCSLPWQAPWVLLSHWRVSLTPRGWPWSSQPATPGNVH